MYDVVIIGAGVIGTFVARELSKYKLKSLILEKDSDVGNEVSKANSAIIHSGYSPQEGTLKGLLSQQANEILDKTFEELDISYKRIGSLLVAFDGKGEAKIYEKYENGLRNNIKGIKIIEKDEILKLEPLINPNVTKALYAPTTSVVNPFEMTIAACENAMDNGVELKLNSKVISIEKENNLFNIACSNGQVFHSKTIVNSAGLYSEDINNMISKDKFFKMRPKRGQYIVLNKEEGKKVNHIIFMAKDKGDEKNRGVMIVPTVDGNVLLGPSAEDIKNKGSVRTTTERLDFIQEATIRAFPTLNTNKKISTFSGVRPKITLNHEKYIDGELIIEEEKYEDLIIKESKDVKGLINIVGTKSPGLTCAPAIGIMIKDIIEDILGKLEVNDNFNPIRRKVLRMNTLTDEQKNEIIKRYPRYGNVICNCEEITEGEIVDCISRNCGATTLDGVKRRVRSGMGECHGSFCSIKVVKILSRELNKPIKEIEKSNKGSYIFE